MDISQSACDAWLLATVLDLSLPVNWLSLDEIKIVHAFLMTDSVADISQETGLQQDYVRCLIYKICLKLGCSSEASLKKFVNACLTQPLYPNKIYTQLVS
jgi:hypothetical protein